MAGRRRLPPREEPFHNIRRRLGEPHHAANEALGEALRGSNLLKGSDGDSLALSPPAPRGGDGAEAQALSGLSEEQVGARPDGYSRRPAGAFLTRSQRYQNERPAGCAEAGTEKCACTIVKRVS